MSSRRLDGKMKRNSQIRIIISTHMSAFLLVQDCLPGPDTEIPQFLVMFYVVALRSKTFSDDGN